MLLRSVSNLIAGISICVFISCNSGNDRTTTTSDTISTESKMQDSPMADNSANTSNIITTAQPMVNIRARVTNFNKWLESYEERDSMRTAMGMQNYVIARGVEDTNIVLIALKTDNIETGKAFINNSATKEAMRKGGLSNPTVRYVNMLWQDASPNTNPLRSMTTFTVNDWAQWESNFREGKQERIDNGIVERVYGHEADDTKRVVLVTAINDSAKAAAYWTSDALKARREKGGVNSKVERFLFRVIRRY